MSIELSIHPWKTFHNRLSGNKEKQKILIPFQNQKKGTSSVKNIFLRTFTKWFGRELEEIFLESARNEVAGEVKKKCTCSE